MEPKIPIDPYDLLIFARIVDAGSLTHAAQRLGLPKSTVSRRLARLEKQLGERLLLRTTRKLTLTEFGHSMLEHARQIAEHVHAASAFAEHRHAQPTGRLRVSMPTDFAHLMLDDVLAPYLNQNPDVALDLDLSPRRVDLIGENFDLAVRFGDLPDDASLAARSISSAPLNLFASPDYLVQHRHPRSPEELTERDALCLVGRDATAHPWRLTDGQNQIEIRPRVRVTANSPGVLVGLACAGNGITLLPHHYASQAVQTGRLVHILPEWRSPGGEGWAVFPGRHLMPARTRAFIDLLSEQQDSETNLAAPRSPKKTG
ncbi:MAG TPA: LysR family transcriptional regulator [Azoarcus sp.]|nr:LysR family transcriptional regulator [Azoarcus sp.]